MIISRWGGVANVLTAIVGCSAAATSADHNFRGGDAARCDEVRVVADPLSSEQVIQLTLGAAHSCAVMGDRTVRCNGLPVLGRLGTGSHALQTGPVRVVGLTQVAEVQDLVQVSTTCARTLTGDVWCWGANPNGQVGSPPGEVDDCALEGSEREPCSLGPRRVGGMPPATRLLAGEARYCVVATDQSVWCWGGAEAPSRHRDVPTRVAVLEEGAEAALFRDHLVIVHPGNRIESTAVLPLPNDSNAGKICLGRTFAACVIDPSRTVRCQRFGDALPGGVRFLDEAGPRCVRDVSVGELHVCAVLSDTRVSC